MTAWGRSPVLVGVGAMRAFILMGRVGSPSVGSAPFSRLAMVYLRLYGLALVTLGVGASFSHRDGLFRQRGWTLPLLALVPETGTTGTIVEEC